MNRNLTGRKFAYIQLLLAAQSRIMVGGQAVLGAVNDAAPPLASVEPDVDVDQAAVLLVVAREIVGEVELAQRLVADAHVPAGVPDLKSSAIALIMSVVRTTNLSPAFSISAS